MISKRASRWHTARRRTARAIDEIKVTHHLTHVRARGSYDNRCNATVYVIIFIDSCRNEAEGHTIN